MSEDIRLQQLIINTLKPEQYEKLDPSDTELWLVEDTKDTVTGRELEVNNAYLTGQISTEPKMLQQLKDSRIRAYDKSKFYIRNNAIITKDGIAGNFKQGSVRSNGISMVFTNRTWELNIKFKTGSQTDTTYARIFETSTGNASLGSIRLISKDGKLQFAISKNDSNEVLIESGEVNLNTDYWVRLTYNNGYSFYLSSDGEQYDLVGTNTTASAVGDQTATLIFGNWHEDKPERPFNGTIDLKEFNFKIDDYVIFDGSYCVDVLKNDYTINGNVNITEDGILTEIKANYNYLIANHYSSFSTLEFDGRFTLSAMPASWANTIFGNHITNITSPQLKIDTTSMFIDIAGSSGWIVNLRINNITWEVGKTYNYKAIINKDKSELYLYDENYQVIASKEVTNLTSVPIWTEAIEIGADNEGGVFECGTIDLNEFKIYVDGNLFYQPTLRVPYTPTNNNSKIVDAKHRARVQEVYEQYGFANYFTLSDDDFTLPIGDLYGLINSKIDSTSAGKASLPSGKFVDLELGTTGSNYTAPADGWIYVCKVSRSSGQYVSVEVDSEYAIEHASTASGNWVRVLCPIRKGQNAWVGFSTSGETKYFRFIYAEGSVQ